jgi:NADH-quinone oxidoreductase subunit D
MKPIWNDTHDYDLKSGKYVKIWQGPQHPGVTGNMSLEILLEGDEIKTLKTHVGYLHRGFEKLMERRKFINCFPIVCRIYVPEPDTNEYLFAAAAEELSGIEIPERAKWIRALTLEMARLGATVMGLGGQAGSFGLGTIGQWTVAHRDFLLDSFEELTGGRIYHLYIIPGGVRYEIPEGFENRLEKTLVKMEKLLSDVEKVMFNNAVFKSRSVGLGVIPKDWIEPFGINGTTARASGVKYDVRKDHPYLIYDQLDFDVTTGTKGDVYERTFLRLQECHLSIDLIRQILAKMPKHGPVRTHIPDIMHWKVPAGETYVRAESGRGEYGYYMVTDGSEYPRRIHVKGPSHTHAMSLLEKLAEGNTNADIFGLMVSLQTYPPEIER